MAEFNIFEAIATLATQDSTIALGTAIAIAMIAVAFSAQKIIRAWKENSTEDDIITTLQKQLERQTSELQRQTEQNAAFMQRIIELQNKVAELHNQMTALTVENVRMSKQIEILTTEIHRLHEFVPEESLTNTSLEIKRSTILPK